MAMEAATCPACRKMFATSGSIADDLDEDDDLMTCPFCMRSFDPYAPSAGRRGSTDVVGIEDLVSSARDDEDNVDDDPDE